MGPTSKTLHTHVDVVIDRSPAAVWAVVADYGRDTEWRRGIVEMTPDVAGPPKVGTKVREVLALAGTRYVTDTVVTETGPGFGYRFVGDGTSGRVRGGRRVRPAEAGDGAVFTYDVELEPEGIPRIARPVLGWWLTRSLRRDLGRLRDLIEAA
jgi:hypothetical protein